MSEKTEEMKKAEAIKNIEDLATAKANEIANKAVEDWNKELTEKLELVKTASEENKVALNKQIQEMQAKLKKAEQTKTKKESNMTSIQALKSTLSEGLRESTETIKGYSGGAVKLVEKTINMVGSFGDAAGYTAASEGPALPLYASPYSPVYLRNIFPNIATDKGSFPIWKRGAVTGEAAIWASGEKPEVDPNWAKETVSVDWIAGVTHVPREVIEDTDFVSTEIPYALIYGKKGIMAAENAKILAYLDANSTPFTDVDLTIGLEKLLGAAFELVGEYMTPTHMLINTQDYLKKLVLNKSDPTGMYDTPDGKVSFVGNQMFINNLIAVPTPGLDAGIAYVLDASQSRFVNRMNIELKMSDEHDKNFTTNMITFRAEERVGFFTYDNASILKVTFGA